MLQIQGILVILCYVKNGLGLPERGREGLSLFQYKKPSEKITPRAHWSSVHRFRISRLFFRTLFYKWPISLQVEHINETGSKPSLAAQMHGCCFVLFFFVVTQALQILTSEAYLKMKVRVPLCSEEMTVGSTFVFSVVVMFVLRAINSVS